MSKAMMRFVGLLSVILLMVSTLMAQQPAARKPNIIWIMADDLGYGDVGPFGQKQIQTPNIDRLAAEGTKFTQAYAGAPVCAPSRCAFITGLTTGHCLIRGNAKINLRPEDNSIGKVLKSAGYTTALVGKWGLGAEGSTGMPTKMGFDFFYGFIDQTMAHNSWPTFLVKNEERVKLRNIVPNEGPYGQGIATTKVDFANDLMHEQVLGFIDQNKSRPFFLEASYTLPHANNEAHIVEVTSLGIYKDKDWPEAQKAQAAAVTRLDEYVGDIMKRLKQLGIDEDTIVFFTSDNGPHQEGSNDPKFFQSSGPLRGIKREMYEGGIREPMIARWPGKVAAGKTSEQVWAFWDFLPTAAELAGATPPANIDGISIVPTLLGKPQTKQHEFLYWEFHEGGFKQAIRMGDWKAVKMGIGRPVELYDLSKDVGETTDVAAAHPDIVAKITPWFTSARTDSPNFPVRGQ